MLEYTARITSQDTPRVGGRNLIVKGREDPEPAETTESYLYRRLILSRKHTFVTGDWYTLSMDVQVPADAKGLEYYNIFDWNGRVNKYGSRGDTRFVIHNGRNHISFKWGETGNKLSNTGLLLYRGFGYSERPQYFPKYPITTSNVTLVKGTIGLESYVPAPEDVADSISTVNTSLVSLASTLLDPDQGEIHKLTDLLDKHSENFEDLATHPLTIDKDGYWQIWSVKEGAYKTTQYQSRGEAGHSPTPEEVLATSRFAELLGTEVTSKVTPLSKEIDKSSKYAVDLINEAQLQLCDLQVLGMSDGGVVEVKRQVSCVSYDYLTPSLGTATNPPQPPKPKYIKQQIPLTLRSSHDALSRQVSNLQVQLTSCTQRLTATKQELAQLKADTAITPVLNADTRKRGSTLYPKYGDWLLTSDSKEQYISFSGLPASIGKSIYIQTRRKAYLNANGHTFYGLPGTSTEGNRWLSNNTTYRFVRADATTWLVTASPSPYPWT